jgi:hypothetical protein
MPGVESCSPLMGLPVLDLQEISKEEEDDENENRRHRL